MIIHQLLQSLHSSSWYVVWRKKSCCLAKRKGFTNICVVASGWSDAEPRYGFSNLGHPKLMDMPAQYISSLIICKIIWLLFCLINVHQKRDKLNISWRNYHFQQLDGKAVLFVAWWFYVRSASPINNRSYKALLQKSIKVAIFFYTLLKCQTMTVFIFGFCLLVRLPVTVSLKWNSIYSTWSSI